MATAEGADLAVGTERGGPSLGLASPDSGVRPSARASGDGEEGGALEPLVTSLPFLESAAALCGRLAEENVSFVALVAARGDRIARLNAENAASLACLLAGGREA